MREIPKVEPHFGRYRIRVYLDGKRVSRSFDTPHDAQAWAVKMKAAGNRMENARCFSEAVDLVIDEAIASRVRPGTLSFYRQQARYLYAGIPADSLLDEIGVGELRAFIAGRNEQVSAGSVAKNLAFLRRVFRRAVGEGWLLEDPTARLAPLQAQIGKRHRAKRYDPLSIEQLFAILDQIRASDFPAAERDADCMLIAWVTGLRRRELADVRVRDVDVFSGRIVIDGKRADGSVFADGQAREALARLVSDKRPSDRLIGAAGTISDIFVRWRKRLNIPELKCHALRHGSITHLVRQGFDLPKVQTFARHATPAMTMRYFHPEDEERRQTAAALHRPARPQSDEPSESERAGS